MKSKFSAIAVICFILFTIFIGCAEKNSPDPTSVVKNVKQQKVVESEKIIIDFSTIITVGNHTYIPLRLQENPGDQALIILTIVDEFEKKNLKLEITNWKIERDQTTYTASRFIYGIWVDHKPKP